MFVGFNAHIKNSDYLNYKKVGIKLFEKQKTIIKSQLDSLVVDENYLKASALEEEWFPEINADVFISHSHKDQELAIGFAGWLYNKFEITSFIDSCVWGYADDLLRMIDEDFCVSKRKEDGSTETYSYYKRNQSTSHVHIILNTALQKMIDKTECLIFINTPNSLLIDDVIKGVSTESPWIYSELMFSRMCQKKKLSDYRQRLMLGLFEQKQLKVKYDVRINHLVGLDEQVLSEIGKRRFVGPLDALDELYRKHRLIDGSFLNG